MRGVIGPESSNNAKEGGGLVPTLLFGIPGSGSMAIFIGALALLGNGIDVGPMLLEQNLDFTRTSGTGVTATSSSNSLTVTGMTHDSGSINFTAVSASVSLTKTMNLAKSKTGETGSTAKSLILTSDSQVFSFPSASSNTATDDDILIIINQQTLQIIYY